MPTGKLSSIFNFSIVVLHFAVVVVVAENNMFDVCGPNAEEESVQPSVIKDGLHIEIFTANTNVKETGRDGEFCEFGLGRDKLLNEITEVSFYKNAVRDKDRCFDIQYVSGSSSGLEIHNCSSDSLSKVFFRRRSLTSLKIKVYEPFDVIDAGVFVQNFDLAPDYHYKHFVGRISFECSHKNPFLTPRVTFKNNDVSANLTGSRTFTKEVNSAEDVKEVAGTYHCSWEDTSEIEAAPRETFDVNSYAPSVLCDVNGEPPQNQFEKDVSANELLENIMLGCSLPWSGSQGNVVQLEWKNVNFSMMTSNNNERKYVRLSPTGVANEELVYTCGVVNASVFENDAAPTPCRVTLRPTTISPTDPSSQAVPIGWIIVIIFVIIAIVVIIVVCCAVKDNIVMKKLKTIACCAGCIGKVEEMRWGTYKTNAGSTNTVATGADGNDVNKNPKEDGDLESGKPNVIWQDGDRVSMDTVDEDLFRVDTNPQPQSLDPSAFADERFRKKGVTTTC